ncbi:OprD family outer membrane porin [Pseudomonas sp. nanlin1]|uniref:OprD family outer membrane porin n=1 Tax=Pseudomonas sp. nanlin1 TaxID=3040605 RepID=UPI00388FE714
MNKSTLALAVAASVLAQQAVAAGFIDDSKASISSRTLYFKNDNRDGANDAHETAQGFKFDYISGFTEGTVGFGVDLQALVGIHLDGGRGRPAGISPNDTDGSAVENWSRFNGNAKARFSKTEAHVGGALAPNLPILVSNDGRVLPQTFQGATIASKEIDNVTINAGQLERATGRASSNASGLSVNGASQESNKFRYAGADWKVTKDLTLQYYHSQLENFYKQNFLGLLHVYPISDNQSFKTDLRYFRSTSDGKNGDTGYAFNNNTSAATDGQVDEAGKVDNNTWSAAFTYSLGGSSFMLGRQQVSNSGGMVFLNQGSVVNGRNRAEGEGGASVYLLTDVMVNSFVRAGENTTFGQYSYDFTKVGVPGLKASLMYLYGEDIRSASGREYSEWERDVRLDYVVQSGLLKGFGTSLRQGTYRSQLPNVQSIDQTRLIFSYTYAFF